MDENHVRQQTNPVRMVAFLGKGPYQECDYNGPDGTYKCERTRYATRAIVEYLCKGRTRKIDEVVIVSTPEARDAPAVDKNQPYPTQWEALTDAIRGLRDDIPIRYRDIPWGGSSDELWEIFDTLTKCFEVPRGTDLVVDITHGFRSQPFFSAAVLSFVRLVQNVSPAAIYYAAFEAKDSDGRAPIWDVTGFVEVLNWALALHLFLNTGRAERLREVLRRARRNFSEGADGGDRGKFDPFIKAVEAWSENFETLRVGDLLLKSGQRPSSAERLKEAIDDEQFRTVVASRLKPIQPLLDGICKKFAELLVCDNSLVSEQGRRALLNLAKLYSEMGRYIEAATVVREATVTLFATSEEGWRPGRSWKPGFSVQARREAEQNCINALNKEGFSAKIAKVRNDLNHAGFNEAPSTPTKLRKGVESAIQWFEEFSQRFDELSSSWQRSHAGTAQTFLNLSNHPLSEWGEEQKQAVLAMGCTEIRDLPFPQVPPHASPKDVVELAERTVNDVPPSVTHAMVMGEFTLTFELVRRLQKRGVRCLVATTTRDVEQRGDEKVVRFHFEGFREYPELEF